MLTTGQRQRPIFRRRHRRHHFEPAPGNDVVGPYGVDGDDGTSMLGDDTIDTGSGDIINDTVGAKPDLCRRPNDIIITTLSSAVIDGGSGWE